MIERLWLLIVILVFLTVYVVPAVNDVNIINQTTTESVMQNGMTESSLIHIPSSFLHVSVPRVNVTAVTGKYSLRFLPHCELQHDIST